MSAALGACGPPPTPAPSSGEARGLPNLRSLGADLWSGGTPDGDDGFRSLRELGIRTVVSVDGIRPDVERARRFGLRYAHLPVEYGGISRERVIQLVRAADELPRPIYIHCHHGQHRGPVAAALMRRCGANGWTADEALAYLKTVGTDPKYEGLYANVREFVPPTGAELPAGRTDFPEVADVPGLTARMVEIDDLSDSLKRAKANGWRSPDSAESAAHLAVRLTEQFREAARLPDVATRPASFRRRLDEAEHATADLEAAIRAGDPSIASKPFDRVAASCASCHREHRDHKRP